jgi:hypothetical protein
MDKSAGRNKCPQCGTVLPPGALVGLCPACLLQQGLAADSVTDGKQAPFLPPPIAELEPLFPQLDILGLIGKGGMGAVYKVRQKQLDRVVALKILPPGIGDDPSFAERFAREAIALAKLNHPGIVTLYEFGQVSPPSGPSGDSKTGDGKVSSPVFFILMEFVDGVNLKQLLVQGRVSPREALAIVPQLCDALQFAHDQGIVHRDIKPENILLDRRGRVKVADFGLARIMGAESSVAPPSAEPERLKPERQTMTDAGKVMGTPHYMAPEQREHPTEVDHRADIYALGVVFYQMLTGELPGKPLLAPSNKVHIDVRLDEVVMRALEKQPERRYQQASEVKTCVETIAASQPQLHPAPTLSAELPHRPPTATRSIPESWVFAVIAVFSLVLFAAWGNAIAMMTGAAAILVLGLLWFGKRDWRSALLVALAGLGVAAAVVMSLNRKTREAVTSAFQQVVGTASADAEAWTDYRRQNQIVALGVHGTGNNGDDAFKYEIVFDETSVALTVSYLKPAETECRVQLEDKRGRRRAMGEGGLATTLRRQGDFKIAEEKKILSRAEFESLAALVLQTRPNRPSPADSRKEISQDAEGSSGVSPTALQASVESWSPPLRPGEKPNLEKVRQEATDLMNRGRYEEALQRQLWYHHHALEYDPAVSGVRLSFALSDWIELGRRYPKARQALEAIRTEKTREFAAGRGYFNLFMDLKSINEYLGDEEATYALFKSIEQRDPALTRQCYFAAEDLLARRGEYVLCQKYMGDPQARFQTLRTSLQMEKTNLKRMAEEREKIAEDNRKRGWTNAWPLPDASPAMLKSTHDRFVNRTRQLIEILVATDRSDEAAGIRDQAIALLDDARLKSAVSDAEVKIRSRSGSPGAALKAPEPPSATGLTGGDSQQNGSGGPLNSGTSFRAASDKVIVDFPNGRMTADQVTLGPSNTLAATGTPLIHEAGRNTVPK